MNRVVNQITNRVLPRDPARPAARQPYNRGRQRAMLLPGLISPKVLGQEYQDVTEDGTENGTKGVTQDKPCCRIRCAPSVSELDHSKRTNSSGRHGFFCHIYHSKCRVSVWIMRARIIVMLCVEGILSRQEIFRRKLALKLDNRRKTKVQSTWVHYQTCLAGHLNKLFAYVEMIIFLCDSNSWNSCTQV